MAPPNVAPVYRWLARQPAGSVTLELPITMHGDTPDPFEQAGYVYASTYHWQPLINGYSGHLPLTAPETYALAIRMPSLEAVNALGTLGLRYVILHREKMRRSDIVPWESLSRDAGVEEIGRIGGATVYRVESSGCATGLGQLNLNFRLATLP